jgi:hypothetical protein
MFELSSFLLQNIEIDFANYEDSKDFQLVAEYLNETTANIIIRRIDTTNPLDGWNERIDILINNDKGNTYQFNIGSSPNYFTKSQKTYLPQSFHPLKPSNITTSSAWRPAYNNIPRHYPLTISLYEFNQIFNTDIVTLPASIFAVGIKDGGIYQHRDSYGGHPWTYEIGLTINHILGIAMEMRPIPNFYFLICALDGYLEGHFPANRHLPFKLSNPDEYRGKLQPYIPTEEPNHDQDHNYDQYYPLLHKNHTILGQCVHPDTAHTIAMPDRYYFCLNRYNLYHAIHRGVPFHKKISKIVFAGNERGNPKNYTKRRDIQMNQREYFKSHHVSKDNIHCPQQIQREEMINYKYILDIDGNASTWDATAWKLNSGSVIFKTDSNWVQWFYDDYRPWTHYIPINDDFSDIQEKFKWCEEHQSQCEEIVKNAKQLFHTIYRHENVVNYTTKVINKLTNSLTH